MSLLQISEPGGRPVRHTVRKRAAGIDLGTTNSLIATDVNGEVRTLADANGAHLLPSAVRYRANGAVVVGTAAKARAAADPANVIVSVKRALGKSLDELKDSGDYRQYRFDPQCEPGSPAFVTAAGARNPVEVSADILKVLVTRAESRTGEAVEGAVITVPAYFNDAQRQQTRHAASLAGIKVLRLLNEPTAAAVAYGLDTREQGNIIVFDLGGGTFDVSLLSLRKGVFEVLATGGDTALGGDDFDKAVAAWLADQCGPDGLDSIPARDYPAMLQAANRGREALSEAEQVELNWNGSSFTLTAAELAELAAPLVRRTMLACRRVLRDARMETGAIDNVLLVGGATRMPLIRRSVAEYFGREPLQDIDPDRVVAIGAGIQAEVLAGNKPVGDFLLLDVNPLSLGIETMGELVEKIIHRNTSIPVSKSQEFTTFKDGQTAMALHVVQGERELVGECRSLARFSLRGIPPMVAGAAKVKVTFQVDADGLLGVSAEEASTGRKAEVQVKPSYGLDLDQVEQMLKDSHEHAGADMSARALREARLEATRLMEAIVAALGVDGELLEAAERAAIDQALLALRQAMAEENAARIEERAEQLNHASEGFAERRMNMTVGAALRGESIDAIDGRTE